MIYLFNQELISSPPDFPSKLHNDGTTPIFEIPEDGPIANFLPQRLNSESKALGIEKVLSKALWRFIETDIADQVLKKKAEARFVAQLNCSTCQGLGIKETSTDEFFSKVLSL